MPLTEEKQRNFDQFLSSLEGTMPSEDLTILRQTFAKNEPAMDKTAQGVMNLADFSRRGLQLNQHIQEVEQQRLEVAQKFKDIAEYERKAAEWEDYLQKNTVSRQEYEAAQATIQQLRGYKDEVKASLKTLELEDLVEDPEEGTMPNNNDNQNPRAAHPGNPSQQHPQQQQQQQNGQSSLPGRPGAGSYMTTDMGQRMVVESVVGSAIGTAQLFQLNNEFRQLTGRDLGSDPNDPQLPDMILEAVKAGRPQEEYIREKLGFAKLREEKRQADMEATIKSRVEAEVARIASEQKLPFGSGNRAPASSLGDVLFKEDPKVKGKPVQPGQHGEGARRATESYLTRRYAGEGSTGSSII